MDNFRMYIVTVVLFSFSLQVASCSCHESEYPAGAGLCCRYPKQGWFISKNCTLDNGTESSPCKNCTGLKMANCTYFSDTQCEEDWKNQSLGFSPISPWEADELVVLIIPSVVITLVLSVSLLCGLYINLKYRNCKILYHLHVSKTMQHA